VIASHTPCSVIDGIPIVTVFTLLVLSNVWAGDANSESMTDPCSLNVAMLHVPLLA